ncbi:restriction endonuclease subunit S [Methanobacterium formicicum]|uniref:Type I restriction-modification system specificity subunit n=1 Tax=Methanobacterium formicicum (strain DSM 3637 / PP1) TaxID=1204725 RepID=K2RAC9_METFP|nr:restriction endonuclease subunit S [Methanobacterium formicicum]EKF85264.1 type I restriction-modification system specificity subunit [Methanobacterium formicicum DSM 3637]
MLKKVDLPLEWKFKPVSEVCDINPRKNEVKNYSDSEKITFLSMESVGENGEIYSQEIKDLGEVFKGYTYFKKNDVLFAKITPCMENGKGTIAKIGTDIGFGSTEFHILRTYENVIPEWVYRFLALDYTRKYAEQNMTGSAGQKRVPKTFFDKLKIPVPPLKTQKKIIEILEKAEKLKEWRTETDELADEYLKSVFLEMFGDPVKNSKEWDIFKFGDVGKLERGKSKHRPRNAPELLGGSYPLIQTGEVAGSGGYIKNYTQTYSEIGLKQSRMWAKGTLCITIAANIAKTGILTFDACFPDSIVGFTPKKHVKVEYVQHWISFLQKILEDSAPESAQKNINLKILSNLEIPIPPLELQEKFVEISEKLNQLKTYQSQSKQEINNLFNTLMQKAFKGELVC